MRTPLAALPFRSPTVRRHLALGVLPLASLLLGLARPARAERHAVFSLVDNRPLAHVQRRAGLYLEAGSASFARYVHFQRPLATWKLRQSVDGKAVALPGSSATLEVPLTAAQAGGKVVYLGLKSPLASTVRVTSQ